MSEKDDGLDWTYARLADPSAGHRLSEAEKLKKAIETRWFVAVIGFQAIWAGSLYLLAAIADGSSGVARWSLSGIWVTVIIVLSIEFGARFRALNDRSVKAKELEWACLCGVALPALMAASGDHIKTFLRDAYDHYGAAPSAAFVVWIVLYGWVLKLPWDRFTDLRKKNHRQWMKAARRQIRTALMRSRQNAARLEATRIEAKHDRRELLKKWIVDYPTWQIPTSWRYALDEAELG